MQTLELLSEIEKNFKIKFKENEINKKNFKDLESLNKLIIKKKK
jgi:acyl carrier protein